MPALKAKRPAIVGWMKNRKFKAPLGRSRKLSHPRITMSKTVLTVAPQNLKAVNKSSVGPPSRLS
jgi:hypothetical protein